MAKRWIIGINATILVVSLVAGNLVYNLVLPPAQHHETLADKIPVFLFGLSLVLGPLRAFGCLWVIEENLPGGPLAYVIWSLWLVLLAALICFQWYKPRGWKVALGAGAVFLWVATGTYLCLAIVLAGI